MTLLAEQPIIAALASKTAPIDLTSYEDFAGRMRFTRDLCDALEREGHLNERYELLDGEIISKVGQNWPHIIVTMQAQYWLAGVYGNVHVLSQSDIEIRKSDRKTNRPQPDIAVLSKPFGSYSEAPNGRDLLLAVEVSDTTLKDDLVRKSALYARAEVPEYWVIDINGRRLHKHQEPVAGVYKNVAVFGEEEMIAPLSAPENAVRLSELLPQTEAVS